MTILAKRLQKFPHTPKVVDLGVVVVEAVDFVLGGGPVRGLDAVGLGVLTFFSLLDDEAPRIIALGIPILSCKKTLR